MYVYQYGMLEECKKLKNTSHSSNFFLSFYQHSTQVLQWQLAEDPLSCLKHHGMCSSDYRELCFLSHITMWSLILSQNQLESASSDTSTLTNTYAIMNVPHEKPYDFVIVMSYRWSNLHFGNIVQSTNQQTWLVTNKLLINGKSKRSFQC